MKAREFTNDIFNIIACSKLGQRMPVALSSFPGFDQALASFQRLCSILDRTEGEEGQSCGCSSTF